MKKLVIIALGCALSACTAFPGSVPASPAVLANQTVLDEQGAISTELAYKATRTAMELAVDAGLLKGDRAAQAAKLDTRAYAAVQAVRTAYRTGNATSYGAAVGEARTIIGDMLAVIR